ncbi:hypothetical protein YC2023_010154 [Brassica napus]
MFQGSNIKNARATTEVVIGLVLNSSSGPKMENSRKLEIRWWEVQTLVQEHMRGLLYH